MSDDYKQFEKFVRWIGGMILLPKSMRDILFHTLYILKNK